MDAKTEFFYYDDMIIIHRICCPGLYFIHVCIIYVYIYADLNLGVLSS